MLANIEQTSNRRRAISTCISNTFARCLLDRVNGVLSLFREVYKTSLVHFTGIYVTWYTHIYMRFVYAYYVAVLIGRSTILPVRLFLCLVPVSGSDV